MKLTPILKHRLIRLNQQFLSKAPWKKSKSHLLFIFGGRSECWPSIGRELYQNEPIFHATILKCNEVIKEINGQGILEHFESLEKKEFLEEETNLLFCITSIQIAVGELWKSKNIQPDGIMGVCIGEVASNYFIGGLTLKEAFKICHSVIKITSLESRDYAYFYIKADLQTCTDLCKKSPVWVTPVYSSSPLNTILYCHKNDISKAMEFFESMSIKQTPVPFKKNYWPFHTAMISKHHAIFLEHTRTIAPKPIQYDYYSPGLGKMIPKYSILPPEYWCEIFSKPVNLPDALPVEMEKKNWIMVHLGPQSILKNQIDRGYYDQKKKVQIFEPINPFNSELKLFKSHYKKLVDRKFSNSVKSNENVLESFRNQLNLSSPEMMNNPYAYFNYLRNYGPIHFLPGENVWIILDYEESEAVLKDAESFSSSINKDIDAVLFGADPPSHTKIRKIIQPLFSPDIFNELGELSGKKAVQLLLKSENSSEFDIVNDYAIPLSVSTITEFLGLSEDEQIALNNGFNEDIYSPSYYRNVEAFFEIFLKSKISQPKKGAAKLICEALEGGKINIKESAMLMKALWGGGITTTSMLISNSINRLLQDPGLKEKLQIDEKLIPRFIEETLRMEPSLSEIRRITTRSMDFGGVKLPADAQITISLRAANRDPKVFTDPDSFLLNRDFKKHLAFGAGAHFCLGIKLARLLVKNALQVFLKQCPHKVKANLSEPDNYVPNSHFRALTSLKVKKASTHN